MHPKHKTRVPKFKKIKNTKIYLRIYQIQFLKYIKMLP